MGSYFVRYFHGKLLWSAIFMGSCFVVQHEAPPVAFMGSCFAVMGSCFAGSCFCSWEVAFARRRRAWFTIDAGTAARWSRIPCPAGTGPATPGASIKARSGRRGRSRASCPCPMIQSPAHGSFTPAGQLLRRCLSQPLPAASAPHIHYLVPGGALTKTGWVRPRHHPVICLCFTLIRTR